MCMFIESKVHSGAGPSVPKHFSLDMSFFALDEEFSVPLASQLFLVREELVGYMRRSCSDSAVKHG